MEGDPRRVAIGPEVAVEVERALRLAVPGRFPVERGVEKSAAWGPARADAAAAAVPDPALAGVSPATIAAARAAREADFDEARKAVRRVIRAQNSTKSEGWREVKG